MPATLIKNATIVTGNPARDVLYGAAIAIDGGRIAALGPSKDLAARYPQAQVVDGRGKAVFPGLINCHAHLTANLFRGVTEDFGFPSSFRLPEDPRDMITDDETTVMALLSAIECARTGCTTTVEIAKGIHRYASDLAKTGLRWALAENTADGVVPQGYRPGEPVLDYSDKQRVGDIERAGRLFEKWHGQASGRLACMVSTGLVETTSPKLLRDARALAEKYNAKYTIHLSQSQIEVESLLQMRGVRPAHTLHHNDYLGPGLVAAHVRYLDPSEVALMGATRSNVSHQPAMAARRAVIPPIPALRAAGAVIGMGTDNNTQDMVEVMRTGMFTERILRQDAANPQPEDVLYDTTMGSARAISMEKEIGSLEPGKKADLFIVNVQRSNLVPAIRIVSSFINNGQPSDIESVMVDGQWVLRDGKMLHVDEASIIAEADKIGRRVWQRLLQRHPSLRLPIRPAPED
ncbi:MAG: amidohydrolase family protein [SAR202 cluster bacterium]|nr:amidohydrolase family protein [SAR202 cluster bacterium]